MQIANAFDPITKGKIKKSFLLGTSGFFISLVTIVLADPRVIAFLKDHLILGAAVTAYIPVIVNSVSEWRNGQNVPQNPSN